MKKKTCLVLLLLVCTPLSFALGSDLRSICDEVPEYFQTNVGANGLEYTIQMGGKIDGEMTRDPVGYWAYDQFWEPNQYVRLENLGDESVVNPWLRRTDRPDTRTLQSIVDFVLEPGMSDAEKARAIWEFEIKQRFHATTESDEVKDVVKRFNSYGYTLCGDESKILSDLWRAAGLPVRQGFPNGHSTAEVFYDGMWHLLDSDESIICLLPDNKTIAGEEEIVRDHWLMKRTHTYGPLHRDDLHNDETSAALHFYEGERTGEFPSYTEHTMDFTLRPGEAITWAWNRGNRFHGKAYQGSETQSYFWNKRWRLFAHVMNGELTWALDLSNRTRLHHLELSGVELRNEGPFGSGLYLEKDSGHLVVPVESAYPVVGGSLEVDFNKTRYREEKIKISISFNEGEDWTEVWTTAASEYARLYIDLNEFFPMYDPARYSYLLRFDLSSELEDPSLFLKSIYLRSTLQMARFALPGLSLGENRFVYTDENRTGRNVRVTHAWTECPSPVVPGKPTAAIYPPDRGFSDGTKFTFQWRPPSKGEQPADYELQVSEFQDFRWVVSPNFHKLLSRTNNRGTTSYELPHVGLLNPDETYYWRVRARSQEGVWGPWSDTFSFQPQAPAVPVQTRASFDSSKRTALISWQPGKGGTKVVSYRIYGSQERGFSPSKKPYVYDAGLDGSKRTPSNLLYETAGPKTSWKIPAKLWRPYYRIAAVDENERESGTSMKVELQHPLVITEKLPKAKAGEFYQAQIQASASIGHLVSQTENGKAYQMRFRNGDQLRFSLSGAPQSLSIDQDKGVIAGFLEQGISGKFLVTVKVTDERTGSQDATVLEFEVTD
jgi:hypothetical protein